jgi:predicted RNA-binding protein YlqC (UPF0109 family)
MRELVELIVKALVDNPDEVEVVESPGDEPGLVRVDVHVAPEDTGKVIGRQGKIANALRTVAKAAAARDGQRVVVEIIS